MWGGVRASAKTYAAAAEVQNGVMSSINASHMHSVEGQLVLLRVKINIRLQMNGLLKRLSNQPGWHK